MGPSPNNHEYTQPKRETQAPPLRVCGNCGKKCEEERRHLFSALQYDQPNLIVQLLAGVGFFGAGTVTGWKTNG